MSQSLESKKIVCRKLLSRKSASRKSSSKKASSRKSSSRKSSINNMSFYSAKSKVENNTNPIFGHIFPIIINSLILYYLINLEDATCNCITDWRHNYIKYFSISILTINIMCLFSMGMTNSSVANSSDSINFLLSIFIVLSLVNMYALYTYIGDLNSTKCECAVDKQKDLNTFLYYYRYLFIIIPVIFIIGVIILLSTLKK
jgi:hypothetical protein